MLSNFKFSVDYIEMTKEVCLFTAPEDSPSNVMTRVLSSQSLFVSWGPILNSSKHNGIIQAYTVKISKNETGEEDQRNVTVSADSMEWTFKNLEEYVVYYVQVAGSTSAGLGPFSAPVFNQTFQDGNVVVLVI